MTSHGSENDDKAEWNATTEGVFIRLCHEHMTKGDLHCSTFDKKTWASIEQELFKECGQHLSIQQLKSKFCRLRRKHREFADLIAHTGFGWNPETNTVTANEAVWVDYLKKVPSAKQFRKKGCEYFDMLSEMFSPSTATGRMRFSSSQPPPNREEDRHLEDSFLHENFFGQSSDNEDCQFVDPSTDRGKGKRARQSVSRCSTPTYPNLDGFLSAATGMFQDKRVKYQQKYSSQRAYQTAMLTEFTVDECMQEVQNLGGVDDETFTRFLNKIVDNVEWRRTFLRMPQERRRGWLERL